MVRDDLRGQCRPCICTSFPRTLHSLHRTMVVGFLTLLISHQLCWIYQGSLLRCHVEISDVMLHQLALMFSNDGMKAQGPDVLGQDVRYTSFVTNMMFAHVMYNRQDVYQKRERDRDNKNKKREGERATSKGIFVEVFSQSTWCTLVYLQTASIQSSLFISIPSSSQFPQASASCNRAAMCTTRIDVKEKIARLVYLCSRMLSTFDHASLRPPNHSSQSVKPHGSCLYCHPGLPVKQHTTPKLKRY